MRALSLKHLVTAAAVALAAAAGGYAYHESQAGTAPAAIAAPLARAAAIMTREAPDFSAIVAENGPAVVNISTFGNLKTAGIPSPFSQVDPDDPFFEFFRRFRPPEPRGESPVRGMGSGFIVSPDGIVLTNAHVVAGANEVTVKLTDKREYRAKVLGMDKATDVAVLKIDASALPTVRLGDPSRTRVGEWVLAIGSPFGFDNSATAGIVSAKSRSLPDEGYVPFIQTDVAVNPGNSGGPLFNASGEVIGINSQIYSRSGGYQGLSFAIPIDIALKVQQQIVAHGKVEHGRLGVTVQDVNQALAESFGLDKPVGALVSSVERGGPAAQAGLQTGDVILAFNGTDIGRSTEVPPLVGAIKPGSTVDLKIWRKGAARQTKVTLGDLDTGKTAAADTDRDTAKGRLGLAVRPLTPEERLGAGVSAGLLVENAAGPAARAGIENGDVILAANGESINSVGQLRALVAHAGKHIALLIQRGEQQIFVPLNLG